MAFIKEYDQHITEHTLTRVWQMMNITNKFGTMTAFRGEFSHEENLSRNKILEKKIQSENLGYWKFKRYWVENMGTPDEKRVHEENFFISTKSALSNINEAAPTEIVAPAPVKPDYENVLWHNTFMGLMFLFPESPQEACLIKYANESTVKLLQADGEEISIGTFHPDKPSSIYSELKNGRTFVFESVSRPNSWTEAILFKQKGQQF